MTTQEKINQLLKEDTINKKYLPFVVTSSAAATHKTNVPSYNLVFPNVANRMSQAEVSEFLKANPPHKTKKLTTEYKGTKYSFTYKFDISSNPHGSQIKLNYIDRHSNQIYLSFPIQWVSDFIGYRMMEVPSTMLHYFGGIARSKIGKMRTATFGYKTTHLNWYGGHETLTCEETIKKMMAILING